MNLVTNPPSDSDLDQNYFYTVNELAELLKVHHTTIYRLVKHRDLPAFKVGADWRFSRKAIERWLAARQRPLGDTDKKKR